MITSLQDLASQNNNTDLPYDCPASAAKRMRIDYWSTGKVNPRDTRIVLGDPLRPSIMSGNIEEMTTYLTL